jgi:hypothetical protein
MKGSKTMLEKVKELFGVKGGALAEIEAEIQRVESEQIPDEYYEAEGKYLKFLHDFQCSSSSALENAADKAELDRLFAIANKGETLREQRKEKIKDLYAQKSQIENEIVRAMNRKSELEKREVGPHDGEISILERQIKWTQYEIERDKKALLLEVAAFDDRIEELNHKLGFYKNKQDIGRLELIAETGEVEARKGAYILNVYRKQKDYFGEKEAQIKEWRRQADILIAQSEKTEIPTLKEKLKALAGIE